VDVAAPVDVDDLDGVPILDDPEDDAVVAAPRGMEPSRSSRSGPAGGPKTDSTNAVAIFSGSRPRSRAARAVIATR
jgi:hypothetical protein